jgi:hypothetical protein
MSRAREQAVLNLFSSVKSEYVRHISPCTSYGDAIINLGLSGSLRTK